MAKKILSIIIICCFVICPIISRAEQEQTRERPYIYSVFFGTTSMQGTLIVEWTNSTSGAIQQTSVSVAAGRMSTSGTNANLTFSQYTQVNWSVGVRTYIRTSTPQYIDNAVEVRNTGQNYSKTVYLEYDAEATRASGTATAYIDTYTDQSRFWAIMGRYEIRFTSGAVPTPTPTPTPTPQPTEYGYTYPYTPPPGVTQSGVIDIPAHSLEGMSIISAVSTFFWGILGAPGIVVVILIIAVGLLLILLK